MMRTVLLALAATTALAASGAFALGDTRASWVEPASRAGVAIVRTSDPTPGPAATTAPTAAVPSNDVPVPSSARAAPADPPAASFEGRAPAIPELPAQAPADSKPSEPTPVAKPREPYRRVRRSRPSA